MKPVVWLQKKKGRKERKKERKTTLIEGSLGLTFVSDVFLFCFSLFVCVFWMKKLFAWSVIITGRQFFFYQSL